ncbi:MAG: aspartate--tRNA ligase [Clostridiales bacterium]|nr:aspartate--tRNA ligase [Clostridiales bacterium]
MNPYRTHNCGQPDLTLVDQHVRLAGWIDTIRDHGGVKFIDLRDHYGVTQVVLHNENALARGWDMRQLGRETVISAAGVLRRRDPETVNPKISTGEVELRVGEWEVLSVANPVPFDISDSLNTREEVRLRYRYLDLRNPAVRSNIITRAAVISFIRGEMERLGFLEIQTPILTSSSPEGARDYLVPSRKWKGKFYALPQAPQQFKQLLMTSGFDKYYQIAPCFRDEDARADRSPGEFYQLDFEMAFATQEDVFNVTEEVLYNVFHKFGDGYAITDRPFPRITYAQSVLRYGSDKPDLRNPLIINDLSDFFDQVNFAPFKHRPVRGIVAPNCASNPKSFFEKMLAFATGIGMKGLGYISVMDGLEFRGPIVKFLTEAKHSELIARLGLKPNDTLFFISDGVAVVDKLAGQIRQELGERLDLIEKHSYRFCFIVDFPMYELNQETGKIGFTHNPFSMPQGRLDALNTQDPLTILAHQYDIVVNGVELSSGAVRNHNPAIMRRAFDIAGYDEDEIKEKFPALYEAFHYGTPPHAGMAPGIDRMLMLLVGSESIRDVIAFPMNNSGQDLLLNAPGQVAEQQLREVHVRIR